MTDRTLLAARGIAYAYPGPVPALHGVDVELRAGELLAVIGPNGSGKSTLVRCLAGLVTPDSGDVTVGGDPVRGLDPRERARRVAVVPQFLPALPDVTVLHFVLGGRYAWCRPFRGATAEDVDIARESLGRARIEGVEERAMSDLSGGQRQRVLLARALAQRAGALVIDEPTNALDPEHQVQVFSLIASLVDQDRAALVVTHDLNLAGQFATRVVVLDDGRVAAGGPVADVLRPEVLTPIYGPSLYYGTLDGGAPFVIPRRPSTPE